MASTIEMKTSLSLEEAGNIFKRVTQGNFLQRLFGTGATFSRPRGDAFSELRSDPPGFAVLAIFGGHQTAKLQKSAVHFYGWDRGTHRELQLSVGRSIASVGVKARAKLKQVVAALEAADPSAQVVERSS